MCGRVNSKVTLPDLRKHFGVESNMPLEQHYNHPPGTDLPVIIEQNGRRVIRPMRWGLVPHWAKDKSIGYKLINARAEGIADKPAFRSALARRRCVVPVAGYFEWSQQSKQPYYFQAADSGIPLPLAGIWEVWKNGDAVLESCAIITVAANDLMRPIHHRMPCNLNQADVSAWLGQETTFADADHMLCPSPNDALSRWAVSKAVNSPKNDMENVLSAISDALF